jgi:excinuclease ABC subunit C
LEKQKVVSHRGLSRDVLGFYREGERAALVMMMVREGSLQEPRSYYFKSYAEDAELIASFLLQYYGEGRFIPKEILLPMVLEDGRSLEEILSERAGSRVEIVSPERGEKAEWLRMAEQNARQAFVSRGQKEQDILETLQDLQRRLHLDKLPQVMECYDISNFQGRESVGSMVVFREGKPFRQGYRHFKIKTVAGANDFASMYEVLSRRIKRAAEGKPEWALPDLIVIDGGKGQLNAALHVLKDQEIVGVDLIALAKSKLLPAEGSPAAERRGAKPRSEERVFLPNRKNPVFFPHNASALFLLVQIRDEAHRFGIEFHRKLRKRRTLDSTLETIPGIGTVRRKKLLRHFGSLKQIQAATAEAIAQAIGISTDRAQVLKSHLTSII